ncbi:MAG: glycosyltransferase family 1 protein [Candidatus Gracilibacteria bacterium]|nr:glycosyltransferase family 1 protein [Candidatus Gracilibacteria bacterium]
MHILFLADTIDNQNAGVHFYTKHLIQALLKLDKKNRYSFIHQKENVFFKDTEHYIIPSSKGLGKESYRRIFKIPKLIKKLKPDIVVEPAHIGPFNIPKSIKRVTIIYDLTPIIFSKFHIKRSWVIHKLLLGKVIRNASLLIAISENTKNDILKLYKTNAKIEGIYPGISAPNLVTPELKEAGLSQIKSPYLLYVGTIEPRKNLNLLVDAFLELKSEHNLPHSLVLAGGIGWKIKPLLNRLKNHQKDIILTGYITEEQKASLYKHADTLIYPSLYEGFGLPPLEAMSYGIPVICSTGGSLKEIFSNHALMFEPNDKETLKKHILSVIPVPSVIPAKAGIYGKSVRECIDSRFRGNDTERETDSFRQSLIKNGLAYSKTFTWEKTAEETIKAFEEITPTHSFSLSK